MMATPEISQAWFEMAKYRIRSYDSGTVWIPLRTSEELVENGEQGENGYFSEYLGLGSIAIPISTAEQTLVPKKGAFVEILERLRLRQKQRSRERLTGEDLRWSEIGSNHWHSSWIRDDGKYVSSDEYDNGFESIGVRLIIDQYIEGDGYSEWHVHHDLLIALGLRRENDTWLDPARGYTEAIRLLRDSEGKPRRIEIKAYYLKDYLAARKLRLRISYYRQRMAILPNRDGIDWEEPLVTDDKPGNRWEGRIDEIHEGGMQYGSSISVFHVERTEIDDAVDVPEFDMSEGITSKSWTRTFDGEKLYRIQGELWKDEWIEPASASHIVAGDEPAPTTPFIVNEKGEREDGQALVEGVRWLWFKPEVVPALLEYRGSKLSWYTRFTGGVRCSPLNQVHFGINEPGLVNVFAKDIGQLPEWQQQIWAAFNVGPEGGVSSELLDSQNRADPADTQAPESYLSTNLDRLDDLCMARFGFKLFQEHNYVNELLPKVHRFRALNEDGLRALAKDLARLIADRLDALAIQKIVSPPKGVEWKGLKSLENLLASKAPTKAVDVVMAPLYGIYHLRLSDAHLPSEDITRAKASAMLDTTKPYVYQGFNLLGVCVDCLSHIGNMLEKYF